MEQISASPFQPLIVSLTTIPERLEFVTDCIETLLNQQFEDFKVVLWIGTLSTGGSAKIKSKQLPKKLTQLSGSTFMIKDCVDVGPHTKLVYSLREFPNNLIVTADDDCLYPVSWLAELYDSYCNHPEYIHCHRAHLITLDDQNNPRPYDEWRFTSPGVEGPNYRLFPTGHGGVLYPPQSLHQQVFDASLFKALCPTNDDVWFKAMSLMQGTNVKKVKPASIALNMIPGTEVKKLWDINLETNDEQISRVFKWFNLQRFLLA